MHALQSLCRGGHRLTGCFSICFRLVNSCVLRFVLTQLAWRPARCRAHRYFECRPFLLHRTRLSGTARGHPLPVQSEAPQTWRTPELSPRVQLGQLSAVGVAVPPQTSLCDR